MLKRIAATAILAVMLSFTAAYADYAVNGMVDDWGVNLGAAAAYDLGYLNTNVPGGTARYWTDDDDWESNTTTIYVNPGFSDRNNADAEAVYIDNDSDYLYFAVVMGTPRDWVAYDNTNPSHGDIFISTDADWSTYEFALNLSYGTYDTLKGDWTGPYTATLVRDFSTVGADPTWPEHASANPWIVGSSYTVVSDPNLLFASSTEQNSHFVLEGRISLAALGLDAASSRNTFIHWTMDCGNDVIPPPVPEPASMTLLGLGLAGIVALKKRTQNVKRKT